MRCADNHTSLKTFKAILQQTQVPASAVQGYVRLLRWLHGGMLRKGRRAQAHLPAPAGGPPQRRQRRWRCCTRRRRPRRLQGSGRAARKTAPQVRGCQGAMDGAPCRWRPCWTTGRRCHPWRAWPSRLAPAQRRSRARSSTHQQEEVGAGAAAAADSCVPPVCDPHSARNQLRLAVLPPEVAAAPDQANAAPCEAAAARIHIADAAAGAGTGGSVGVHLAERPAELQEAGQRGDASGDAAVPDRAPAGGDEVTVGLLWTVPEGAVSSRRPAHAEPPARASAGSGRSGRRAPRRAQLGIQPAHAPGYVGKPKKKQVGSGEKASKGRARSSKAQAGRAVGSGGKPRERVQGEKRGREAVDTVCQEAGVEGAGEARQLQQACSSKQVAREAAVNALMMVAPESAGPASGEPGSASETKAAPVSAVQAPAVAMRSIDRASPVATDGVLAERPAPAVQVTHTSVQPSAAATCHVPAQATAAYEGRWKGLAAADPAGAASVQGNTLPASPQVPMLSMPPAIQQQRQRQASPPLHVLPQAQLRQGERWAAAELEQLAARQAASEAQQRFLAHARAALALLMDRGSLEEDAAATGGVVTARGGVHGAPAYAFCLAFPAPEGAAEGARAARVGALVERALLVRA